MVGKQRGVSLTGELVVVAKAEFFAEEAQYCEEQFRKTRNPLFAWMMWSVCRTMRKDMPAWLLDYFDRVASDLLTRALNEPPKSEIAMFAGKVLGFDPPQNGANPFEIVHRQYRARAALADFLICRRDGQSSADSYAELIRRGVGSESTVKRLISAAAREFDPSHPLARYLPKAGKSELRSDDPDQLT